MNKIQFMETAIEVTLAAALDLVNKVDVFAYDDENKRVYKCLTKDDINLADKLEHVLFIVNIK